MGSVYGRVRSSFTSKHPIESEISILSADPITDGTKVPDELIIIPAKCLEHNGEARYICVSADCTTDPCICGEPACYEAH